MADSTKKVVILTDSASDLGAELRARYDIGFVPFLVMLGEREHTDDGQDITQQMIFDFVSETKVLPKTAARNSQVFVDFFRPYIQAGHQIVYIGISQELSLQTANAMRAAAELAPDDIFVVDSRVLSSGIGLLCIRAAELRDEGKSAGEIAQICSQLTLCDQTSFVVDTVEYLHKGGRCSGLASFFASILSLHPTIRMKSGRMYAAKKYMGAYKKIIDKYIIDTLEMYPDYDDARVFITHCAADPESIELARKVLAERTTFREVLVTEAGSTVSSHCGRGTLGILYLTRSEHFA